RVLVDIQLDDLHFVAELTGDFLERRTDHAAGSAPFGPKIHDHRFGRLQNIRFKTSVRHFADGHGSYLYVDRGESAPKIARAGNYERSPAASRRSHAEVTPCRAWSRASAESSMRSGTSVHISAARTGLPGYNFIRMAR